MGAKGFENMEKKPYKRLEFWKLGYELLLGIYKVTAQFPAEERYGITSQLRRASTSVCANIVEGYAKESRRDYLRYLRISRGSLAEVEFFLELSLDLHYFDQTTYDDLDTLRSRTGFLLYRYIRSLEQSDT
jgi:four helix bundle protein